LIHDDEVANKPSLRSFVVTDLPQNILGEIVRFKIQVTNQGGYSASSCEFLSVVIADIPATPTNGPVSDKSFTTDQRIRITYDEPYSGGSILINYEVVMDDGEGGGFRTVAGGSLGTHLTTFAIISSNATDGGIVADINRGFTYRFKYRAQNVIGWSDYSPVSYI